MKKKLLSSLLIGAFVFGVGAANVQPVSAASLDKATEAKQKYDKTKSKIDKTKSKIEQKLGGDGTNFPQRPNRSGDSSNPPEPPKDENGNPMPPPDRDGDNSNRPEPPKDENGNPLPPPDKNSDKNQLGDMKDRYDSAKDNIDQAKKLLKKK